MAPAQATTKNHPGFRQLEMTSLIALEPHQAKARILDAYRRSGCSLIEAAKILGCNERTAHRWVDRLEMRADLEKLTKKAKEEGWLNKARRPVGGRGEE